MAYSSKPKMPRKPRPSFPLFVHQSGRWCKKVLGKHVYFGKVADDPKGKAALELWLTQKDDLLAGRVPRTKSDGLTVEYLCNRFLMAKEQKQIAGEITNRQFQDLFSVCSLLLDEFGNNRLVDDLLTEDFSRLWGKLSKRYAPGSMQTRIPRIKSVFKFGYESGILEKPMRFGPEFKPPSRRVMRVAKQEKGSRTFTAEEIKALLSGANPTMQAMVLLGINAGFGNSDCAMLPLDAVELNSGWIFYYRHKTGIERRCKLWPETVKALRVVLENRPKAKTNETSKLFFVTTFGNSWGKQTADNPVQKEMTKLLRKTGLTKRGRGFYGLRHTFRTVADGTRDFPAVRLVMGHVDDSMDAVYRESIQDERLIDVSEFVRTWLFSKGGK